MELTRIDTIVQFTLGTSTIWNNESIPVPLGAIVVDTANKIIKEGDGVTLFENLPVCLDYNFHSSTSGAIVPEGDNVGVFAIADDMTYSPAGITLQNIVDKIVTLNTKSAAQQGDINASTLLNRVDAVTEDVVDGTMVVCQDSKYIVSDRTLTQFVADLVAQANTVNASMHITDLEWYTDSGLTNKILGQNEVTENNTYWCKVTGFHDIAELSNVDFGLATVHAGVTITNDKAEATSAMIAAIYGGTGDDRFTCICIDSSNNVYTAGYTKSEGLGGTTYGDALIVKFDKDLNILVRKRYGGTGDDLFTNIDIDSLGNIYAVGQTSSEGAGGYDALIVKFDSSLNILAKKRYGGTGVERFYGVAVDSYQNVYAVGYTQSEGNGSAYALIIKFDSSLNIIARKRYGGTGDDDFINLTIDSSGNIYAVGYTKSEGNGSADALIIKFDNNLNILARKRYGGTGEDVFYSVISDSSNNVYTAGYTKSEGLGGTIYGDALIVKFDSSLNILARKRYGGTGEDVFYDINIDSSNNVYTVGLTSSEGLGGTTFGDALIVIFDSSLNIVARKRYGGTVAEDFRYVNVDAFGNIYAVGLTTSEGSGNNDALIIKIPSDIPSGTITGTILSGLTFTDITTLTLADSALTIANSTLTLVDSTLTLADSTLTLATSTLTLERDVLVAARMIDPTELVTAIYTSAETDKFIANTIDSAGNIIAVGSSVVSGTECALVVKFDSELNALYRKLYNGNYAQAFNSVVTDSSNNIICVGRYSTSSGGANEAFVVKFSSDLSSIIIQKAYGATGDDVFNDITISSSGHIYIVGYTTSEGSGLKDGLIVKFDSTFAVLYRKRYGGTGNDVFMSITTDASGNALVAGYTSSEGANTSGLVIKFDSNLNIVLRKYYNSTLGTTTEFHSIAVTSTNVIYCVGRIVIATGNKGLIVKFDSNLNTTGSKVYGNIIGGTEFTGVKVDSELNVFVVGKTNAEGAGNYDALIMKFSSALAILGRKIYGTVGEDADIDCIIDSNDDVIISGYSVIGSSTDAMITKMPNSLREGLYSNKFITDLILSDSKLKLSDDVGTVGSSTTAMNDSTLILSNGSMSIINASGAIVRDVTIMDAVGDVFKVKFGNIVGAEASVNVSFVVTANDGDETISKNIDIDVIPFSMIAAVYGGTGEDKFRSLTVDSSGNVYGIGYTHSEGTGSTTYPNALIIKFDNSLNILARKIYGGSLYDTFYKGITDPSGNLYVVGETNSEGAGGMDGLIIKFDSSLNILARKRYGGTGDDYLTAACIDSSGNVYVTGQLKSEGLGGYEAVIIKFDSSLNILARKRYGGTADDAFNGVCVDSSNNVYVIGWTNSEGSGNQDGLIVKFDSSLNIIARKRYGGTGEEEFHCVKFDTFGNVYVVGYTTSEGSGNNDGLIIKFDSNLNILASKRYGGAGNEAFSHIVFDSFNNIYICASTTSEGSGGTDALIVKLDRNFNILASKRYGGTGDETFIYMGIDGSDNIFCAGNTTSEGLGSRDCLIVKLPSDLKSGTFIGSVLTELNFTDVTTLVMDDTTSLVLADSALTLANSALTLANSTLTLTNSTITLERDVITT